MTRDDSQAEAEVVREEASGSVQEVSRAEMHSRFEKVKKCFPDSHGRKAAGSDDSQAEAEVVREEASGSVQEVSHAEMQARFAQAEVSHAITESRFVECGFRCV